MLDRVVLFNLAECASRYHFDVRSSLKAVCRCLMYSNSVTGIFVPIAKVAKSHIRLTSRGDHVSLPVLILDNS